jgi:hypothetical protein
MHALLFWQDFVGSCGLSVKSQACPFVLTAIKNEAWPNHVDSFLSASGALLPACMRAEFVLVCDGFHVSVSQWL